MSEPKKHHILSQFYLDHFAQNGRLQIYDRTKNEFRESTPHGTAFQKHFYSIVRENGVKDTSIEKWLSSIEGKAQKAIIALSNREILSPEQEAFLALFMALMLTRTTEFDRSVKALAEPILKRVLTEVATLESAEKFLKMEEAKSGLASDITAEKMYNVVKQNGFSVSLNRNMPLQHMISVSEKIANILLGMNWMTIHAPSGHSFVTCDDPFVIIPPEPLRSTVYGVGVATPGAVKLLTLTQNVALLVLDPGTHRVHKSALPSVVEYLNLQVAIQTDRLLIGRDKSLLQNVVTETRLHEVRKAPRVHQGD